MLEMLRVCWERGFNTDVLLPSLITQPSYFTISHSFPPDKAAQNMSHTHTQRKSSAQRQQENSCGRKAVRAEQQMTIKSLQRTARLPVFTLSKPSASRQ